MKSIKKIFLLSLVLIKFYGAIIGATFGGSLSKYLGDSDEIALKKSFTTGVGAETGAWFGIVSGIGYKKFIQNESFKFNGIKDAILKNKIIGILYVLGKILGGSIGYNYTSYLLSKE